MDKKIGEDIRRFILRKMLRKRMWVHKHTSIHNLPKGLPDNLRSKREVRKVIDKLVREQILLSKPTNYGLEVSLNIKKKKQIEDFVGDVY
jgi:hypothetical protein